MVVPSNIAKVQYDGNGSTADFSTGFTFLDNSHVRVILTSAAGVDTEWTEDSQYTLTGADTGQPGTVTASPANVPASGTTLTIIRDMPFTQTLEAGVLETLPASELEDALDNAMMSLTQLKEKVDRAITESETGGVVAIMGWSPEFAIENDGARRVLKVVDWEGGTGTKPDVNLYVGTTGLVSSILSGVDIRGTQGEVGASGPGSGDMVAAQNLADLVNPATAFANIKQAATVSATGVVELATTAEAVTGTDTSRAVTPAGVQAALDASTVTPETFSELQGLGTSNAADTANDITIAAGKTVDLDTGAIIRLNSAITKRLDAAWAAGTNQGGRDTGAISDGTWHLWLIGRSDTGVADALFSLSASAPTMPAAEWDAKRRIASVIRLSSTILQYSQMDDEFLLKVPKQDANAVAVGTTAVLVTLSVPTGVKVRALVDYSVGGASTTAYYLVTALDQTDTAPTSSLYTLYSTATEYGFASGPVRTDTQGRIRIRADTASRSLYLNTRGWMDSRGR